MASKTTRKNTNNNPVDNMEADPINKCWEIIGRGFNGWHAKYADCSSSGGNLLPYTYWTGKKRNGYLREAKDGAFVYDASHLTGKDSSSFINWVLNGPIVAVEMPHNTINRFNNWPKKTEVYDGGEIKGFDYISKDLWISELIKRVPNIKYGFVVNGDIVWATNPPDSL
jgi:hypothetical protein